jgi:hypothetical protein
MAAGTDIRGSDRFRTWLPWVLFSLSSGLTLLSLWLLMVNRAQPDVHVFDFWIDVTVIASVCPITGALIASRRPENRIGWIFCVIGLLVSLDHLSAEYAIYALLGSTPALPAGAAMAWIRSWIWVIYHGLFVFLGLLFPTGRLPAPHWRPVAWSTGLVIVIGALALALTPGPVDGLGPIQNPLGIALLQSIGAATMVSVVENVLSLLALAGAASLALRVRYARGEERLQLKWFAYAGAIAASGGALTYIFTDAGTAAWLRWGSWLLLELGMLGMPIAVAIAILRYRLYEIDVVINRTLVYASLTGTLALVYFGSVVLLEQVFRPALGQDSNLAIVISTLTIAALFQPMRGYIQKTIDRRFFRPKYDMAQTLQTLSTRLRDELDLNRLTDDLVGVVDETLQPQQVSLWLSDMPPRRSREEHSAPTVDDVWDGREHAHRISI